MATLLLTHPAFVQHDTGPGHPERADRMRAIDKVLAHEATTRFSAPKRRSASMRRRRSAASIPPSTSTTIKGAGRGW